MKKIFLVGLVAWAATWAACNKQKGDAIVKFTFKPTFGSSPMALYQWYPTPNGDSMQVQRLDFFVSDIVLVRDNGKLVTVLDSDAKLVDFSAVTTVAQAQEGVSFTLTGVAEGDFKEIRFGVGVAAALNSKDPGDFPTSSPLGDAGNYWTAWDSYIFSRVEGTLDTSRTSDRPLPFLYHTGVNSMYQARTFSKSFTLKDNQTQDFTFTVDAEKIFYTTGDEVNIRAINVSHTAAVGTPQYDVAVAVARLLGASVSLQ